MEQLAYVATFVAGGVTAWTVRGALDRAVTGVTIRALVEAVGKDKVDAAIRGLRK